MTSPLLRLFAASWWLLVIGSTGFALYGTAVVWLDYHSSYAPTPPDSADDPFSPMLQKYMGTPVPVPPHPSWHVAAGAVVLLLSLLPFAIMTVIRWIITARWRFGPRW
jgi:hypothetical protein